MLYLLLLSGLAASQTEPVTNGDQDVLTLSEHADAICPMLIDQSIPDTERGRRLVEFTKQQGYRGSRFNLLSLICTQWLKGYAAGARQGPVR